MVSRTGGIWQGSTSSIFIQWPLETRLIVSTPYSTLPRSNSCRWPRRIQEELDRLNPTRVVFDSLTQVRLLSRDQLRYRRQILALKSDLLRRGTTTLFLADRGQEQLDSEIASIVQGVISLTLKKGREGLTRRFIEVEKCRGSAYCEGEHPLRIGRGGLEVFPRLLSREHERSFERASVSSSVEGFDAMLGGGLDRGTCTLIIGNTGVGKTTLGMAIVAAAVGRGESAAVYTFDEGTAEMVYRSEAVGLKIRPAIDSGLLRIRKVNPLLLYPDEFAAWVRVEVEQRGVKVIMIDSLNGYNQSMPDENYLAGHMHQLIGYLNQMGVVTILVNEVSDLIGGFSATRFGLSYMADTVVFIHYYEFAGAMHKAIGVLKKRLSNHDKALRAYHLGEGQISVGKLLPDLHGILRGEPSRNYILPEGGSQLG